MTPSRSQLQSHAMLGTDRMFSVLRRITYELASAQQISEQQGYLPSKTRRPDLVLMLYMFAS